MPSNVTLKAEFTDSGKLQLKDSSGNINPSVTFTPGPNTLTIERDLPNLVDFWFAGLKIYGVDANGMINPEAAKQLRDFSFSFHVSRITITDTIPENRSTPLNYEYTIYCQRATDGKVFQDDPRIINSTGG